MRPAQLKAFHAVATWGGFSRAAKKLGLSQPAVSDHVRKLAVSGFASHVKFEEDYDPSLPPLWGDRDLLVQIFLNLTKNAAEAIGGSARRKCIWLTTSYRPGMSFRAPGSQSRISLPLQITVEDNGPGVSEEIASCLFDPFVTTKRGQGGSGLGMHLVYNLVTQALNGSISITSEEGNGVEFVIIFPVVNAKTSE